MHINNTNLPKKILSWYDNNKRTLPWRISPKSKRAHYYRVLSEFMLQQTQVKTVIPYFKKFVIKIPNLKALSNSSEKKILKLWEGLGFYRRARNLLRTAKVLVKDHKSKIPSKFEEIKKLPGVGNYTANILLALIYNQPRIGIDGNVKRVLERIFGKGIEESEIIFKESINRSSFKNNHAKIAEALMEFGALVCKSKDPQCNTCNLKKNCFFFKNKKISFKKEKILFKEKNYNIFCYLKKEKNQIALTKNKNLGFLNNFFVPEVKIIKSNKNIKKSGWIYLCKYKNSISNIKMNINLFYKFTKNKPQKFKWYSIDGSAREFIPSFTKKIITKISKVYI